MSIFDNIKPSPPTAQSDGNYVPIGIRTESISFSALPESLGQMQSLPQAELNSPFDTAALTVCALCVYAADSSIGADMLNWLRGPRPLNGYDISFINDRFRGGKTYIPFTYFSGAKPENNYSPATPYTVTVSSDQTSEMEKGYIKLFIACGGADAPRPIKLRRRASDGKWFLWEQYLLTGVKTPIANDDWA